MTSTIPVNPHAPVTPPPENINFSKMPHTPEHEEPFSMKAFQDPAFQNAQLKFQQAQRQGPFPHVQSQQSPSNCPAASSHNESQPQSQPRAQAQQHLPQPTPSLFNPTPAVGPDQLPMMPSAADAAAAALDPKYLAMVSRIAAYYQQRCQAVANYQQQRCQAWAAMQRQKCQEMVQAAMLVVAWYIRDRIQRRRRRQKRRFRNGLTERCSRSKVTKGEVVRRWVLQVPESAPSPNEAHASRFVDREEAEFDIDRENPLDKDTKLFGVADNLIKSQLAKIEVPLMGALSFDESESEDESDPEEVGPENVDVDGEEEDEQDLGDLDDGEELYDDEDMSLDDDYDELGSYRVQNGTGDGSRPKNESSIS